MTTPTELCQLATDWRGDIPSGGTWAEVKHDGWRAPRFPGRDELTRLWTRNGHVIEGVAHILHRLEVIEAAFGEPMLFDSEFQVDGSLLATKTWCERGWKFGGNAGVLHLFDAVPLSEWRNGGSSAPLYERKAKLAAAVKSVAGVAPLSWELGEANPNHAECADPVRLVEGMWLADTATVVQTVKGVWAAGGEGLVLKDADAPYQRKRSPAWRKVKRENMTKWSVI
jgi:ATP-dependent DNA ligase